MESQQHQELLSLLHQLLKEQTSTKEQAKQELTAAQKEIESLKELLASKDALITSKNETINLLTAAFNRPN